MHLSAALNRDLSERAEPLAARAMALHIARLIIRSLHWELTLYPKPGLVSRRDNGAHDDMDAGTFLRSLFSLRHYFAEIALAGWKAAPMNELRHIGIAAEVRMLAATNGINTHRGAIFTLGLLAAAAGRASCEEPNFADDTLREVLTKHWRRDLLLAPVSTPLSHGQKVAAQYGVSGARDEAVRGFPAVFEIALPALRHAFAQGVDAERAGIHAFFTLLANVIDTNVLYRGGSIALADLQRRANHFLNDGSVFTADWFERAEALHEHCSQQCISPGGCADLLAAAWFVHQLQLYCGRVP